MFAEEASAPKQFGAGPIGSASQKEKPRPKRDKNSSWNQDEDTATDTQIATVLRREETAAKKSPAVNEWG